MDKLISRSAVIDIIENEIRSTRDYLQHDTQINIQFAVEELPVIEAISKKVIDDVIEHLEKQILQYDIQGKHLERSGWYTLACTEYGKRDGLLEAINIIKEKEVNNDL